MESSAFDPSRTLIGRYVRLEPLRPSDAPEILAAGRGVEVQRWLRHRPGDTLEGARDYVERYQPGVAAGTAVLYAVRLAEGGRFLGVTGFHRLSRDDGSVEIGGTWLTRAAWRTAVNTDMKLAMLRHAFDDAGLHRVTLQTHHANARSQRAIADLGAVREAEFRDDVLQEDGTWRTSIVYGILRSEWPTVRSRLDARLRAPWDPAGLPPPSPGEAALSLPRPQTSPPSWAMAFRVPRRLEGPTIELLPLERAWVPALARAGHDPAVWQWLRIGPAQTEEQMGALVDDLLRLQDAGEVLAFVVRSRPLDRVVGMFRYLHIDRPNGCVELGTWLAPDRWRTGTNSEVKFLALSHAFDTERFHRVGLRTDLLNDRSQRAIERLGARREGVLREHVRLGDGRFRSSVCYSILDREWPVVRSRLSASVERLATASARTEEPASR